MKPSWKLQPRRAPRPAGFRNEGHCAGVIAAAGRTPLAVWLRTLTDGCLASEVLPARSKLLMLAVIARQLGSQLCEWEACESLAGEGFPVEESATLLATLASATMTSLETTLLRWTRETVWYEPRSIQNSTRRLLGEIGEQKALEAIGSAALCNTLARLSLVRHILVTEEVHSLLGDRIRMTEMPAVEIKGKSQPIVTWAVEAAQVPKAAAG